MTTVDVPRTSHASVVGLDHELHPKRQTGKGTSIVLIDRRPLTRQCIARWLQDGSPDLHVVALVSPVDLLDTGRAPHEQGIVIFSIDAASVRDSEVRGKITLLRHHMSRAPLVLLCDREDVDDIVEAIEHGVRGYISTSLEPAEAAAALQCVAAGGTFVPPSALLKVAQDRTTRSLRGSKALERGSLDSLTPRENEVLARLRQGKPNKIIAHELAISESTVKVFVRRILMKLGASNRTEVACLVRDHAEPGGAVNGAGRALR